MMNLKKPSTTILHSSWIVSAMALVAVVSLDWSSMCHPSPEGVAIKNQIRNVQTAKVASTSNTIASTSIGLESYTELTWKDLTDVEFKDVYVDELDAYYWKPIFGPLVKDLEGGKFYITGYVIPVDIDEDFYVLSRYPICQLLFLWWSRPRNRDRFTIRRALSPRICYR